MKPYFSVALKNKPSGYLYFYFDYVLMFHNVTRHLYVYVCMYVDNFLTRFLKHQILQNHDNYINS